MRGLNGKERINAEGKGSGLVWFCCFVLFSSCEVRSRSLLQSSPGETFQTEQRKVAGSRLLNKPKMKGFCAQQIGKNNL